jgi:hypothetical protein
MDALHEQAVARRVRRVLLEVIVENTGAFALYEQLGYRVVRDLEVWILREEVEPATDVELVSLDVASTRIPAEREPWQRADASIPADAQALAHEDGAAIFRATPAIVQLLQIGGDRSGDLVAGLRRYGPVSALNLPAGGAAAQAFAELGGTMAVRQHEMLLEL